MASLTKIMTLLIVLELIEKYKLNPDHVIVDINEYGITEWLGGTSAELLDGEKINVTELMYGMMLPSGNDAA